MSGQWPVNQARSYIADAVAGNGPTPLVGPQTNLENFSALREQLNELAKRIEVCANNMVGQNHFLVELKEQVAALANLVQRNADALLKGQQGLERAVAIKRKPSAGVAKKGKRRP